MLYGSHWQLILPVGFQSGHRGMPQEHITGQVQIFRHPIRLHNGGANRCIETQVRGAHVINAECDMYPLLLLDFCICSAQVRSLLSVTAERSCPDTSIRRPHERVLTCRQIIYGVTTFQCNVLNTLHCNIILRERIIISRV